MSFDRSIDFRNYKEIFDNNTIDCISNIYSYLCSRHQKSYHEEMPKHSSFSISSQSDHAMSSENPVVPASDSSVGAADSSFYYQLINALHEALKKYYKNRKLSYTKEEAEVRADQVFSLFLQQSIYFAWHNAGHEIISKWVTWIIQRKRFIYEDSSRRVIWVDPKERCTVFTILVRNGDNSNLLALFKIMKHRLGINSKNLKKLITYQDKNGFSPFHIACRYQSFQTAKILLEMVKEVLGKQECLRHLITLYKDSNDSELPLPLHFGIYFNNFTLVPGLIEVIASICGGKNTFEFWEFFCTLQHKFTSSSLLHCAIHAGNLKMFKELIDIAVTACGNNTSNFWTFITCGYRGYSPFHCAVDLNRLDMMDELINITTEIYGGMNNSKFQYLITQVDQELSSPLHIACKQGNLDAIKKIIAAARATFCDNLPAFQAFLEKEDVSRSTALEIADTPDKKHIHVFLVDTYREMNIELTSKADRRQKGEKRKHSSSVVTPSAFFMRTIQDALSIPPGKKPKTDNNHISSPANI